MSSCCSVSAKSMICPRLRRVLVGFYSMVARLGGLALVVLLFAGCGGGGAPPGVELVFRHSRMPGQDDPLPRLLRGFEREHPGVRVTHEPLPWTADVQHQFYVINVVCRLLLERKTGVTRHHDQRCIQRTAFMLT